ncbi:MAG: TIGR03067 domain-containing protein [Burkholderiales bacterium]
MVVCLAPNFSTGADGDRNALDSLEGVWEVMSVVSDGLTLPLDAIQGGNAVFSAQSMTLISPDGKENTAYAIRLDPSTNPKAIDITSMAGSFKGDTGRGIYDSRGNVLWLCQPHQPGTARPSAFAAPQGSRLHLTVLKRPAS